MESSLFSKLIILFSIFSTYVATELYSIEGIIQIERALLEGKKDDIGLAKIFIDGGNLIGIPSADGRFKIHGLAPSRSYAVEVAHPTYVFPQFRVDINSKGQMRARMLNNVQPKANDKANYPLIFRAMAKTPYFIKREEWRITDMLMNPMILMMVLPMVLLFVLPKMMNAADDETRKEMESIKMPSLNSATSNMPDISSALTGLFGGAGSTPQTKPKRKTK